MPCLRGLTLSVLLFVGWASRSEAQTMADPKGPVTTRYGDSIYQSEPYGGFGLETIQTPFAGTIWLDRFGMVHATEPVQPSPRAEARRSRGRATAPAARRRVSQSVTRL